MDKQLEKADPPEAKKIVENLDAKQKQTLKESFDGKSPAEQKAFADNLAGKLEGEQLSQVRGVLDTDGGKVLDQAVERHAPDTVQADYQQAKLGVSDKTLQALGLTTSDLKDVTKPVAEKLEAVAKAAGDKDIGGTIEALQDLKDNAGPLARDVLTNLVDKSSAPQALKDLVNGNGELVGKLLDAGKDALQGVLEGDLGKVVTDLASNTELRDAVIKAATDNPAISGALEKLGNITPKQLKEAGPELLNAAVKAASGDYKGAALELVDALKDGSPAAQKAFAKAASLVDGLPQPVKDILSDPKLQDALSGAGADALKALVNGKPQEALSALTDPKLREAVFDAAVQQQPLKGALEKLDIDPEKIKASGDAIPSLVEAVTQLHDGKPVDALKALAGATDAAAPLVSDIAAKIGEKLPGDSATGQLLKSIVTDKALVAELLGNDDLHAAVGDLFSGKVSEGLQALGDNDAAMKAIADHIVKADDPATVALRGKLEKLGYTKAEDIATIGPVLADVVKLGDNLAKGKDADFAQALVTLGEIGRGLPDDARSQVLDKLLSPVTEHLPKLSPEIKELVKASVIGLTDPEVAKTFVGAIKSLPDDPGAFLKGIVSTASALSSNHDVSLAMLNALGKIGDGEPQKHGNIGAFFADPDFNETLVKTGSVESFFQGVEEILVNGDLVEGLKKFGGVIGNLIQDGDDIKIGGQFIGKEVFGKKVGFHLPSVDLPIGEDGFGNIGQLLSHIKDGLPESARNKIDSFITDAASKVVTGSLPWKQIPNLVGDVKKTVSEWGDNSMFENVLNVSEVVAGAGSLLPGAGKLVEPLKLVIGIGQGLMDAKDAVETGVDLANALGVT
ncbi:MAG TPA: hypothetical protein VK000_04310 [Luteimonas sp.]|nr:hypothetical protein [Luteimonas sp.]